MEEASGRGPGHRRTTGGAAAEPTAEGDVKDEKDYSLDGNDRAEWDQAWVAMPHRRLLVTPKIEVAGPFGSAFGEVVSVTISADAQGLQPLGLGRSACHAMRRMHLLARGAAGPALALRAGRS